jgi:hypothetical protein
LKHPTSGNIGLAAHSASGYEFRFPHLEAALRHELSAGT